MQFAKSGAIVAAAALASGGIALAAAAPGGAPSQPGRVLPSSAASAAQEHAAVPLSAHPSGGAGKTKAPKSHGNAKAHGSPHRNLNGLCHAWLAGAGNKHGKARSNPAFTALITAAGGTDRVAGYCAPVVKAHPSDDPSESDGPTESDHPGDGNPPTHPSKPAHPAGRPDVGPPASHPAGRPSSVPPTQ